MKYATDKYANMCNSKYREIFKYMQILQIYALPP